MSKVCNQYVGSACIGGNCPKAHVEEFLERGIDIIKSCNECVFYKECEDCVFYETKYCVKWRKK